MDILKNDSIVVDYYDVYGDKPPAKPDEIFRQTRWSPNEDYLVLPYEGWAKAPGAPENTAVNLNKKYDWTVSIFSIEDEIWLDDFLAVGNSFNDCDYSIKMFDGMTGNMINIKNSISPIGYRILKMQNDSILIESILDNCATLDLEQKYKTSKELIPISTIKNMLK